MIVDTSAIMAIVLNEPEREAIITAMLDADRLTMSCGNWIELQAIVTRRGNPAVERDAERLFAELAITIAPVTVGQAQTARAAYRTYGRGTRHAADLNFGDCFAYALAKESGEALLFKGDAFGHTDVASALA